MTALRFKYCMVLQIFSGTNGLVSENRSIADYRLITSFLVSNTCCPCMNE